MQDSHNATVASGDIDAADAGRSPPPATLRPAQPAPDGLGFTLIELITTVAIAMVLLTIAIPNFSEMIGSHRLSEQANRLVVNLALARSEARTRHALVVVCKSADAQNCGALGSVHWEDGWIMFVDDNNDGTRQAGELLIRSGTDASATNTLRVDANFAGYIAFRADGRAIGSGRTTPPAQGAFRLCDDRGAAHARVVEISPVGRASVTPEKGTATCP